MNNNHPEPIATVVSGHTFTVDSRYVLKDSKILGKGSFGVVTTAYDAVRKIDLAIKRIRPYANDEWDARHTLREIRLLKLLGDHPNIISLFELSLFEQKTELYMMIELMDCDLHRVIQSKQPLSEKHHKCFIKQILEGIKSMHAIGVFHRDLKPGNILVSKDCQLRITDFGLARFMDDTTRLGENQQNPMTEYVVTRWYRCPELLLSPNRPYNEAIDLWSIGCILAELIKRKPLFPGKSHANQVQLIFEVVGYSPNSDLGFPLSAEASTFLDKRCRYRRQPFNKLFSDASVDAVKFIEALLLIDPSARPTAAEALHFSYLQDAEVLHDYDKTYLQRPPDDFFDFEREKHSVSQLKDMIDEEVRLSSASLYRLPPPLKDCKISSSPRPASNIGERDSTSRKQNNNSNNNNNNNNTSGKSQSHLRRMSDAGSDSQSQSTDRLPRDESDGPVSQMATQVRGDNNNNNYQTQSQPPQQQSQRGSIPNNNNINNPFRKTDSSSNTNNNNTNTGVVTRSREKSNRSSAGTTPTSTATSVSEEEPILPMPIDNFNNNNNLLTAVRNEHPSANSSSSSRQKPKTPSPKKMEQILQKDLSNKKRFLMQGMAKQKQQQEADEASNVYTARSTFPAPDDETMTSGLANNVNNNNNGSKKLGRFIPSNSTSSTSGLMSQLQMTYQNLSARMGSSKKPATAMIENNVGYNGSAAVGSHRSSAIMNSGSNVIHGEHELYTNKKN